MTLSRNWKIPLLPMSLRGQWMMVIVTYEPSVRQESLSISPGTDGQWSHGQEWNVPHCSHYTICITGGGHVNLHPAMRYKAYSIITFIKILFLLRDFLWRLGNMKTKTENIMSYRVTMYRAKISSCILYLTCYADCTGWYCKCLWQMDQIGISIDPSDNNPHLGWVVSILCCALCVMGWLWGLMLIYLPWSWSLALPTLHLPALHSLMSRLWWKEEGPRQTLLRARAFWEQDLERNLFWLVYLLRIDII